MSKSLTTTSIPAGPNNMPPIHPGEILRLEFLEPLEMSPTVLARALGIPPNRVIAIVNEQRSITAETAILLEAYFKVSAVFWLNLQRAYDLKIANRDKLVRAKALKITPHGIIVDLVKSMPIQRDINLTSQTTQHYLPVASARKLARNDQRRRAR
jgi:antitoxin HigA-1